MAAKKEVSNILSRSDIENNLSGFLEKSKKLALLLDFDGTLAPIVEHPDDAKMPKDTENILKRLTCNPNIFIAIISGRQLADVKSKAGLTSITYAGNHGFEIEELDGKRSDYELPREIEENFQKIIEELISKVAKHGAWVENKRVSLTFHFRKVSPEYAETLANEAREIIKSYGWISNNAHCAIEGKPPIEWNKGEAAKFILQNHFGDNWQTSVKVIFVGDDTTDEDAMKVLQGIGKSFRISPDPTIKTYADFRLESSAKIPLLLEWIENVYS